MNGDEIPEKRHRHDSKHDSKHSNHHKTHSHTNEKVHTSSKHKRPRDSDESAIAPKKQKSDSSNASSSKGEKTSKTKHRKSDDGIEIDHSMGTSFADALGNILFQQNEVKFQIKCQIFPMHCLYRNAPTDSYFIQIGEGVSGFNE